MVCESCGAVRAVAPAELDAVRAAVLAPSATARASRTSRSPGCAPRARRRATRDRPRPWRAEPGRVGAGWRPGRRGHRPARRRLRPALRRRRPAPLQPRRRRRLHRRGGADGLHPRAAPRLRRRPHRRHRQHDAQAHERRSAAAGRRVLLLARALDRGLRARAALRARGPRAGRPGAGRRLDSALRHGTDRHGRVGRLPLRDRRPEPGGPRGDRARAARHAQRDVLRGRARGAAALARAHEPSARAASPTR